MTTVLMADDSALLREGLVGLLERQGYEIVGQEHRADALLNTIAELAGRDALPDEMAEKLAAGMRVLGLLLDDEFTQTLHGSLLLNKMKRSNSSYCN